MQVRFPLVQPMAAQCGSYNDTTDSDAMSYFACGAGSRRFESGRGRQQNSKRPRSSEDRAPNVLAQVFFGCFRFRSSIGSSGELLTQGLQVQALPGPPQRGVACPRPATLPCKQRVPGSIPGGSTLFAPEYKWLSGRFFKPEQRVRFPPGVLCYKVRRDSDTPYPRPFKNCCTKR